MKNRPCQQSFATAQVRMKFLHCSKSSWKKSRNREKNETDACYITLSRTTLTEAKQSFAKLAKKFCQFSGSLEKHTDNKYRAKLNRRKSASVEKLTFAKTVRNTISVIFAIERIFITARMRKIFHWKNFVTNEVFYSWTVENISALLRKEAVWWLEK